MRLLHRLAEGEYQLTKVFHEKIPEYAILSHTWLEDNDKEITLQDFCQGDTLEKPDGWAKIQFCGEQAAKDGLEYFWIDTCCIDKTNNTEFGEAIVSMFSWYRNASTCYAYLTDVFQKSEDGSSRDPLWWEPAFRKSRWFTRGWTLQELVAPESVQFFSKEGFFWGSKASLMSIVEDITQIPSDVLRGGGFEEFDVEDRLEWGTRRNTKRSEDKVYCMLGICNVQMLPMYGEGEDGAFRRLRLKIEQMRDGPQEYLDKLPHVPEAAFNSLHNKHESFCLENTRVELLERIEPWVEGVHNKCIFYLNGMAGTGKSTVARTIAKNYYDKKVLGGTFFFSEGGGDLKKADKMAPTLAKQLAFRVPEAKRHICDAIRREPDIFEQSIRDQWQHLILDPLSKLPRRSPPSIVLLVLDALDECDSDKDVRMLFRILAASQITNIRLRILITSRPETYVRKSFQKIPEVDRETFILHEVEANLVERDLQFFFENRLKAIGEELEDCEEGWPDSRIITRLVEISSGLFIWAATACRFIKAGKRFDLIMRRIAKLFAGLFSSAGPPGPYKHLDQIYIQALQASIRDIDDDEEKDEVYETLRRVLGAIVVLSSTLSMESLAKLLDLRPMTVKETLVDLHTILNIPSDPSRPVRLHHPTFRDFLLNEQRCVDRNFWVDEKQAHRALGDHCVHLMSKMLERNICGLKSPGTLVENVEPGRIARCIPPELRYACLYWVEHYRQSGIRLRDGDSVSIFFKGPFLCWLETMNLMGKGTEMGAILSLYHSLLMPYDNIHQIPFVKDARRMMFHYQNIIRQAPLQTYCAVLVFIPPSNELRGHFRSQIHPWIEEIRVIEADVPKAGGGFSYVSDLAFSPDGKRIASGSNFEAVRFWDIATKATIAKYEGDEGGAKGKMSSVAMTLDGTMLAGGSDDFTVLVWDVQSRSLRFWIKSAHKGWVNSVAFSPDGRLLVSCSMDQTVGIWSTANGELIKRIDNHSSCVNSATFSPNGLYVATGSVDETVRLWDISKASNELHASFDGHSGPINCVRFSPDGKQIVSGSDDMKIKIWDTKTESELITLAGHTKKVMAVAFSLDARLIASGSEDKTVIVWDVTSGARLRTLTDHTTGINSVLFSPDNKLLAAGSFNDEVRLWDTKRWVLFGKLDDFEEDINSGITATQRPWLSDIPDVKGHSKAVTSLVMSPDSKFLASGSQDASIKLWKDGKEFRKCDGHSGSINDLAFSPDGKLLASASTDTTIRLWDVSTGTTIHTIHAHSAEVLGVLFSFDGKLLASFSTDKAAKL